MTKIMKTCDRCIYWQELPSERTDGLSNVGQCNYDRPLPAPIGIIAHSDGSKEIDVAWRRPRLFADESCSKWMA